MVLREHEITKIYPNKNSSIQFTSLEYKASAQKTKLSIMDFSNECDQIRSFKLIWSNLLEKPLMGNFIFCAVAQNIFRK